MKLLARRTVKKEAERGVYYQVVYRLEYRPGERVKAADYGLGPVRQFLRNFFAPLTPNDPPLTQEQIEVHIKALVNTDGAGLTLTHDLVTTLLVAEQELIEALRAVPAYLETAKGFESLDGLIDIT